MGAALAAAALAEYAFTIEWIRTRASDSVELCRWIGVLGLDASSRLRNAALVAGAAASLEFARACRRRLDRLPPALRSGCAPEPSHVRWPPETPADAARKAISELE